MSHNWIRVLPNRDAKCESVWDIIISFRIMRARLEIGGRNPRRHDGKAAGESILRRHSKQHISPITSTGKEFAIQLSLPPLQVKCYSISRTRVIIRIKSDQVWHPLHVPVWNLCRFERRSSLCLSSLRFQFQKRKAPKSDILVEQEIKT